MIEAIKVVLKGIDQTELESPDGWWETSAGAEFGAKKLKYILGLLAQPAQLEECNFCPRCGKRKPWVGLTDEEINELWAKTGNIVGFGGLMFETIRAVEAKLKEKNT